MADTFTNANSSEEQSTSPVVADYAIITSIGLTASISSSHYSKFMQTFNVQNAGGGGEVGLGGRHEMLKSSRSHGADGAKLFCILCLFFNKSEVIKTK